MTSTNDHQDPAWDDEADVICVGSGIGGVSAAITTADCGGDALVLEKSPALGGVTAWSVGQLWVGANPLAEGAGISDSTAEATAYIQFLGAGLSDPSMLAAFIEGARRTISYFVDEVRLPLEVIRDFPDYYYPHGAGSKAEGRYLEVTPVPMDRLGGLRSSFSDSPHGVGLVSSADVVAVKGNFGELAGRIAGHVERDERCAGAGLMIAMLAAAAERGVRFRTGARVSGLVTEEGRLTGVTVTAAGGEQRIRARRGVVLATGGLDHNPDLTRTYEQLPELHSMAPISVEGDHVVISGPLGARVAATPPSMTPRALGFLVPGHEVEGRPMYFGVLAGQPHMIVVNRNGARFGDESFYHDIEAQADAFDGRTQTHINWPAWLIFDQNYLDKYPLGPIPPGTPLPEGMARTAATLRDLAAASGIDPDGVATTVERFNRFSETGVDQDFHRGELPWSNVVAGDATAGVNPNLGPIGHPPYYAIPLVRIGTSISSAGLATNESAQVVRHDGSPIEGLHAVGNAAARLDTGGGYNSGIANTRGLAFGHISARHLMQSDPSVREGDMAIGEVRDNRAQVERDVA
jgi:3-oxosteroid 1-dehydrogenase